MSLDKKKTATFQMAVCQGVPPVSRRRRRNNRCIINTEPHLLQDGVQSRSRHYGLFIYLWGMGFRPSEWLHSCNLEHSDPIPTKLGFLCKCWRLTGEGGTAKITSTFILPNSFKKSTCQMSHIRRFGHCILHVHSELQSVLLCDQICEAARLETGVGYTRSADVLSRTILPAAL